MMGNAILFNGNAEAAVQAVTAALARRGLRATRSFDLRSARAVQSGCACPHHGTSHCTCQYVVLLVYASGSEGGSAPAVLTLHSQDRQAHVELAQPPGAAPIPQLADEIMTALLDAALSVLAISSQRTGAAPERGQG